MARRDYPFDKRSVKFGAKLTADFLILTPLFLLSIFDGLSSSPINNSEKITPRKTTRKARITRSHQAVGYLLLYSIITLSILLCLYILVFAENIDQEGFFIFIILVLLLCLICDGGRIDESYNYLFKNKRD